MGKGDPEREEREANLKIIADLFRAIEELESGRKKPEQLEGIKAEARLLAQQWKIKESGSSKHWRPLFRDDPPLRILLLAALVVAQRRDHEFVLRFPNELELEGTRGHAELMALAANLKLVKWRKLTAHQQYERRRNEVPRPGLGLIGDQFGGRISLRPLQIIEPTCLDDIFAGRTVDMMRLVELFGVERHRLSKLAVEKRRFTYRSIVTIMDKLLRDKPRQKRKRSKPGAPRRMPWLNDQDLRARVLSGIEARINTLSVSQDIKSAFEEVVRRYSGRSGKK